MRKSITFIVDKIGFLDIVSVPILSRIAKDCGWNVQFVEFSCNNEKAYKCIQQHSPDVIAYSICSSDAEQYLKINALLKDRLNFYSVFGGAHPTFFPMFIENNGVDAICRGEGDIAFSQFLTNFYTDQRYDAPNFVFRLPDGKIRKNALTALVADLDSLPFPDRNIIFENSYFLAHNPIKIFSSGRGCPYNCSYCFNHSYNKLYKGKGAIVRLKSVDYLLAEIHAMHYPMKFIKFHDDIFGLDPDWLTEFAEKYPKEIGLPFLCYVRPNIVTEEYCRKLKKAGCYSVCMAIECGNGDIRNTVLERNMSDEVIYGAVDTLKKYGLKMYTLNMVGLPGETDKEICETIMLNRKIRSDFADATIFQPYPNTTIHKYCIDNGFLDRSFNSFKSLYSESVLNVTKEFKAKVVFYHLFFSGSVANKYLLKIVHIICNCEMLFRSKMMRALATLFSRVYYGYFLTRNIYMNVIPFHVLMVGWFKIAFNKTRI